MRDSANPLCQRRQDGRLREKIRKAWKLCRKRGPFTDAPHAPRLTRPGVLLVIVREEFGLVGRHVGMGGAVALAAFAGEAPVEGLFDLLALPAAFHYLALKHLEKQPCAPARGIALLAGRPIARAHRPAGRRPAFAHADTVLGRAREPVAHLASEREARRERDRLVRGAQPQIFVSRIHRARATYELARVHAVFRVPDRLELAERSHEFFAVHRRQELGLGLTVAVLTRQRAAVFHDQGRSLGEERAPLCDSSRAAQVESDARMDAAIAKMPVERGLVSASIDQGLEFAQVVPQAKRIDRRVFPSDDRIRTAVCFA